jgi:hypothetical protein
MPQDLSVWTWSKPGLADRCAFPAVSFDGRASNHALLVAAMRVNPELAMQWSVASGEASNQFMAMHR